MPTEQPTEEQVARARQYVLGKIESDPSLYGDFVMHLDMLLAATALQSASDPRPADMAEFARLTAKELRGRGILATVDDTYRDHRIVGVPFSDMGQLRWFWYVLLSADFDNLGPVACADVIQAEERKRAQEWAGDDVE